jgi:hypothetical protein
MAATRRRSGVVGLTPLRLASGCWGFYSLDGFVFGGQHSGVLAGVGLQCGILSKSNRCAVLG